ncbi:MAG: cytochrome c family protein [Rhizobiales bacterium]|nr:cytochrome c family protein [Hyphomicrobiales bacterium]
MNSSYLNAAAGAFLGVVFILMTISITSEGIFHVEAPETAGFAIEADESAGGGASAAPAEEELAPIAPLMAEADPAAGENVFKKCASCHSVDPSGTNKVGPGLYGVVGRPVASHEGFNYSAGMKEHVSVDPDWTYEALNHFLHAPKKYVPGTAMGFAGLKKEEDRANVIAYLRQQADSPVPLPDPAEAAAAEGDEAAAPAEDGADSEAAPEDEAVTTEEPAAATTTEDSPAAAEPAEGTEEAAPAEEEATTEDAAPAEDAAPSEEAAPAAEEAAPAESGSETEAAPVEEEETDTAQ